MAQGFLRVVWSIFWAFILILFSFEIAFFCASWYIMLLPFTTCFSPLSGLTDVFLRGVQLPYFCSESMLKGRSLMEAVHSTMPPEL
ncbi:hypothetical protein X975_17052, partial [Stegodyphus mimosarum]